MSLFNRKEGSNRGWGIQAPSYDPYGMYTNSTPGVFGYRKDEHVVMPGTTFYEQQRLSSVIDYVANNNEGKCSLQPSLIHDVYSMYVNKDVKRRPDNGKNSSRHKVLDAVYDSLTKVVTTDSPLFSQILLRELALALQFIDEQVREEQSKGGTGDGGLETELGGKGAEGEGGEGQGQEGQGEGEGEGDGENAEGNKSAGSGTGQDSTRDQLSENAIDKALEASKDLIQGAKDKADQKIKELEDQLGKETLKDLAGQDPGFLDKLENVREIIKDVTLNRNSVRKVLEKILNKSQNYFSTKHTKIEESLFDCEECDDLFGLEFLNPIFKNAELMNIGNESRVYRGKFDLFLDCSGSMGYTEEFEGKNIKMINLVKGIAMTMHKMGLIENLYFFDNDLYQINNVNEVTILTFSKTGGTNFNNVVRKIKENNNNSVIITDGEDGCKLYDKRAFWIGVGGTQLQGYGGSEDAFKTYREANQCVTYNPGTSSFEYCK